MKKILRIIFYILMLFLVIYNVVIYVQKIFIPDEIPSFLGYNNFIVYTGSMENTLSIGDIIFVKEQDEINVDDIIAFEEKKAMVTHRVIDIIEENGKTYYKTKGDANTAIDTVLTSKEDVKGVYIFKIPKIGFVILLLQTPLGIIILLTLILVIYFYLNNKEENSKKSFFSKSKH